LSGRKRKDRHPGRAASQRRRVSPPTVADIAGAAIRGASDLLTIDDPLEAEAWASQVLGLGYKMDAPWEARQILERTLGPALVSSAEARSDPTGLAALAALAAVADDRTLATAARAAAERLRREGIEPPPWVAELGSATLEDVWMLEDVFGDHEAYFATFRYPGREAHVVNALYDKAMGEIIKDGFVGYTRGDIRSFAPQEPGVSIVDCDPGRMARRVTDAIASGDMYLDNDWAPEFKQFRALILARMRTVPMAPPIKPPKPPTSRQRKALIGEFLASQPEVLGERRETSALVEVFIDYSCDHLGDDPFRWSPIVVEQLMLDFLPRKVSLGMDQVRDLPAVLRAWVRFALTKRGLEERWIDETERAVDRYAKEFRRAMTDAQQWGPAKALGNAILADGIDPLDQASVDRWIDDFNALPQADRERLLGRKPSDA
jgi:hypothetical protein